MGAGSRGVGGREGALTISTISHLLCHVFHCAIHTNLSSWLMRSHHKMVSADVIFQNKSHKNRKTNLCDILNKVLAKGESAAYEPHGDHMVGQRHNVLVEPNGNGRNRSECVCASENIHVPVCM